MSKVSIIVPVYNVEEYLERCINSILKQTLKDIEIILVNDGSTDRSREICKEYLKKDKRIMLINKKNGGLSSARNEGIKKASGEYIAFVDSDDIICENMMEILYYACIEMNCTIAQCQYKRFNEDEEVNTEKFVVNPDIEIISNINVLKNLYNENYINTIVAWNKLYKKEIFKDIRYPEGKLHEDEYLTYKILYNSNKIAIINEQLYFYRSNPTSITKSKYKIERLDSIEALEERYNFFLQRNLDELADKTLNKYARNILAIYYRVYYEIDDNNEILRLLRRDLKKYYINIIKSKNISWKLKIIISIFNIYPCSYIKYMDFRREK